MSWSPRRSTRRITRSHPRDPTVIAMLAKIREARKAKAAMSGNIVASNKKPEAKEPRKALAEVKNSGATTGVVAIKNKCGDEGVSFSGDEGTASYR